MSKPQSAMDDVSDDALVVLYGNGDASAAQELVSRLAPKLFAHANRVLGDRSEAEDVVQETMMRLWRRAPEWEQGPAKVSTWVYTVAINLCRDRLRKRARTEHADTADDAVDLTPGAEARLIAEDRSRALHQALLRLPERQRQAVVLRHLEEMPNPEIAEVMGTSIEATESLLARGRKNLKAILRLEESQDE